MGTAGQVHAPGPVLSTEGLAGEIRADQEQALADLISKTPDTEFEEKSDYYFRLSELYIRQLRYWQLQSIQSALQADEVHTPEQKAKLKADAEQGQAKAKEFLLKAAKNYQTFTDNEMFRNYPKMDRALLYYGFTLRSGKYMKEASSVYNKLLKNYPNSKYVPEAHLAFADYFFEINLLDDAEARYRMVLKFPKSPAYWYAMYKMGWIDLNKQRFQDALETFFQVAQATRNDKKEEVLNRASKKDIVRAYAEIGKADKAFPAFQRVDQKYAFDMLEMLVRERAIRDKQQKRINKKGVTEQPRQSGPESGIKLTVVRRDERKLKEALAAFAAAAKEYDKRGGKTGGDEVDARYYYAAAKFAEVDKNFEAYLDIEFPQGLDFDPAPERKAVAAKSLKRFNEWFAQKTTAGEAAKFKYNAVLAVKDAANSIAVFARFAQITQHLSDMLFSAEIPEGVRTGKFADEKVEAFCDALTEKAEPLEATSLEEYGVCLSKSTELGWFSDWSKLCERELGQIKPEAYPTASELHGAPEQVGPIIAIEPLALQLE